jgi:hypothetical protein
LSGARELLRSIILGGLVAYGCSLTSSLDDLKGSALTDAGLDAVKGGTDSGAEASGTGGTGAGTGGTGGTDASGGTGAVDASGGTGGMFDPCVLADNCPSCCVDTHQTGAQGQVDAIKKCVCSDAGFCAAACKDYCLKGTFDLQCNSCIGTTQVQTCLAEECKKAPDCETYTACVSDCNHDK